MNNYCNIAIVKNLMKMSHSNKFSKKTISFREKRQNIFTVQSLGKLAIIYLKNENRSSLIFLENIQIIIGEIHKSCDIALYNEYNRKARHSAIVICKND